jgi:hypothetical protein
VVPDGIWHVVAVDAAHPGAVPAAWVTVNDTGASPVADTVMVPVRAVVVVLAGTVR